MVRTLPADVPVKVIGGSGSLPHASQSLSQSNESGLPAPPPEQQQQQQQPVLPSSSLQHASATANNDLYVNYICTSSGLRYFDNQVGTGELVSLGDKVKVCPRSVFFCNIL